MTYREVRMGLDMLGWKGEKILFTPCPLIPYYYIICSKYILKIFWSENKQISLGKQYPGIRCCQMKWLRYKSGVFWLYDFSSFWIYKKVFSFNIFKNKIILEQQMRFSGFTKFNQLYQHKNAYVFSELTEDFFKNFWKYNM